MNLATPLHQDSRANSAPWFAHCAGSVKRRSVLKKGTLPRLAIDPLIAAGVVLATAATDAVYVMFTSAVVARRRVHAASWSSVWYLLSSFAVIHYTEKAYVAFAAAGSRIGAFATISFMDGWRAACGRSA
jgi:hypothetical protein